MTHLLPTRQPRGVRWRSPAALALALLFLLGLALRLYNLAGSSLSGDEAISALFYSRPLGRLLQTLVRDDLHPPLYPLFLDGWMRIFGDGEFALRLPSVLFGALIVPAVYLAAGVFWADDRDAGLVGLLAAGLTALSPVQLYYSQEARNYILITLLTLLSGVALFHALRTDRRRDWLLYGLATLAALYTHYNAFFILPPQVVVLVLYAGRYRRRLLGFAAALGGALLLFAPWAYFMVLQLMRISDFLPLPHSIEAMGKAVAVELVTGLAGGSLGVLMWPLVGLAVGLVLLGALSVVRLRGAGSRSATLYLLLSVVFPLATMLGIWAVFPKYGTRYLIIVAPAVTLLIARGLVSLLTLSGASTVTRALALAGRSLGAALTVAAIAGSAVAIPASFAAGPAQDYRALVAMIDQQARPTDAIGVMPYAWQPIKYYLGDHPELPIYSLHFEDDFEGASRRLNEIATKHGRIWVVSYFEDWTDPARFTVHSLDEHSPEPPVEREFPGLKLALYGFDTARPFTANPTIGHPADVRFANGVVFRGWDVVRGVTRPGERGKLDLHWVAERPIVRNFKVVVTVEDAGGHVVARLDQTPIVPTFGPTRWAPGKLFHGQLPLDLSPGTPPGAYQMRLLIYDEDTYREVDLLGADGQPSGTRQTIGDLAIDRSARPAATCCG